MIVNVWRSIDRSAVISRMPLAVLDCTTVMPEDLFTVELIFKVLFPLLMRYIDTDGNGSSEPTGFMAMSTIYLLYMRLWQDRVGENLALDDVPAHQWYFYPKMQFNEALMFKTFDNNKDTSMTGRYCIHSAFIDPSTTPEDPMRQSIEVRVLAIFDEEIGGIGDCVTTTGASDHA